MRRSAAPGLTLALAAALLQAAPAAAEEARRWKADAVGKTHTVAAVTGVHGPGRNVSGLPMTYDMSLFEWNWGGRQSPFNGAGITTNSNFPLAEGEALATNTDVGVEVTSPSGLALGLQGEWYGLAGDRTVGRVFGEELPWDNFDQVGSGLVPARSNLDLDRAWLRYAAGAWSVKLTGGNLPPQTLPEFTRKPMNHIRLGSLVWRPPITNASYFEKEDRKLEEGRHPVRGGDLIVDYEYGAKRHLHLEFFSGQAKPTPIANVDRLSWGGRAAADVGGGNVGVTFIRADGDRPRAERENQWALDGSHPAPGLPWLAFFGALARSSYTRGSANLDGTAVVAGAALKGPKKSELKAQYQWAGENYDLIGTHKVEHYPSNFRGVQGEASLPAAPWTTLKGIFYHLRQMETNTRAGDTIFGDSYFPALANSRPGTITVWKLGGETGSWHGLSLRGYLEQAHFRKDARSDADDIDKTVTNLTVGPVWKVNSQLSIGAGIRHLTATGRWQAMRFHHRQEIPELSVTYQRGLDLRATLIYQRYGFQDSIAASAGRNNYEADQLLAEFLWRF